MQPKISIYESLRPLPHQRSKITPGLDYESYGYRYWVEYNDDLTVSEAWWSGPSLIEFVEGSRVGYGDGTESVTIRLREEAAADPCGYLRVRAQAIR